MSGAISPETGRSYGVERVCEAWEMSRSGYYVRKQRKEQPRLLHKRGPKPKVSDGDLLALIRSDLAASPFVGEGHRKVWARLRLVGGIVVGRNRVLRVMREHNLLSPHRSRRGPEKLHQGEITTKSPKMMWGTDGAKIYTLDEGWVWCFAAVEHFNAECVGWHVVKHGDRFAALEPIRQGVSGCFGGIGAGIARGLALRFDHGSQYTSDDFQNEIKFFGIAPSPAFVSEPETNGVSERFFRTLKEQAIYGRSFRNVTELREAVARFVETYNNHWRLEKLGYLTPIEARRQYELDQAA